MDPPRAFIEMYEWPRRTKNLGGLMKLFGEAVYDLIWPQIKHIAQRLNSLGLWHSGLRPSFIIVDQRWNVQHIIGWIFCTKAKDFGTCSLSQIHTVYSSWLDQKRWRDTNGHKLLYALTGTMKPLDLVVEPYLFKTVPMYQSFCDNEDSET